MILTKTELVISIGHNPGTNHPRMMGTLHELARRAYRLSCLTFERAGAGAFCRPAEYCYRDGDLALDEYRLHLFSGEGRRRSGGAERHCQSAASDGREQGDVLDRPFITEHTQNFPAFADDLQKTSGKISNANLVLPALTCSGLPRLTPNRMPRS